MLVGVISDTHGYFHSRLPEVFASVEKIIHLGDIGSKEVFERLCELAPVIAIKGNNEPEPIPQALPDPSLIELAGRKIFLTHRLLTMDWEQIKDALLRSSSLPFPEVDMVLFGHTHYPVWDKIKGIYFLNPGYAGSDPLEGKPTCALLEISPHSISAQIVNLSGF